MRLEALALCLAALAACSSPALAAEPAPVAAHWVQAGWGGGGFYWACAFHPAKPGVIYAGGDVVGVYKTDDAGRHWRIINNGLADYAVYSLAVDRKAPDTVYAGTEGGLCKSTDAGEHWEFLKETAKNALHITAERGKSVRAVAVDPTDSAVVYAGTPIGKIFKSLDGGQTWKCLYELPGKASVMCVAVAQADPKLILAATTTAGILRSEDAGATWTPLDTPKAATSAVVAPSDPAILYASFGKDGVRKSGDRGKTWAAVGPGIDAKCSVTEVAVDP
ncbi:MAG: hypothetical protein NT049_06010, partial [Planctomycetota bacterium]|nr:hypothetical protein [Planctomycetota bacterium]